MRSAVIVGGGVIGLCCAYSLVKRDFNVTLLDSGGIGSGASQGNAGWITPSLSAPVPAPGIIGQSIRWMLKSDSPLYVRPTLNPRRIAWLIALWRHCNPTAYRAGLEATARLNMNTLDLFDQLEREGVEFEQHRAGLMFCFLDRAARDHVLENLELMRPYGYTPASLEGGDVAAFEPALSAEVQSGIFVEQERQVRPESLTRGLSKLLLSHGADLRPATPVLGLAGSKEQVRGVRIADGVVECDEVVIAAGAHSGTMARELGVAVPIDAGKGYSLHYEPAPISVDHPLYLYETRVAVTPFSDSLRLAGTMEFSGLNTRLRRTRLAAIAAAAERYLGEWPPGIQGRPWAGMRPMTPDGLPVIGRISGNVSIASGHAMLGITLAPATGEAIADLLTKTPNDDVIKPFDPARFSRRRPLRSRFR